MYNKIFRKHIDMSMVRYNFFAVFHMHFPGKKFPSMYLLSHIEINFMRGFNKSTTLYIVVKSL